uniref:Beclin 1, autophagy related n=1 Tax=Astyanax mexicanus TaxID=7994 RepID=A0A3B1ID31_ASTMX
MEGSKSSSTTMQVSFVCQRCSQPLKLDTSFNVLDRGTIQELIGRFETFVESKPDGVSRKYIPPARNCLELLSQLQEEDEGSLLNELQQLRQEEDALIQQLEAIEEKREVVAKDLSEARVHTQQLDTEELQYQKEYCEFKRQQLELDDELKSVDNQMRYCQTQLDRLKKTNVFNATFHIWHSGQFGTINNFRLGRLPSVPVEWNEINAAWGQTVLLLHALANKMGLRFQRYRLVPYGNHSYLESLTDKSKVSTQ